MICECRVLTNLHLYDSIIGITAGPSGRAVSAVGPWPLMCWECGFESCRGAWMSVPCQCCVFSGRGLCDGL